MELWNYSQKIKWLYVMLYLTLTGADVFKDDGVYSRYFIKLKHGKYSVKVRVENGGVYFSHRYSGALYIPGFIVDGNNFSSSFSFRIDQTDM